MKLLEKRHLFFYLSLQRVLLCFLRRTKSAVFWLADNRLRYLNKQSLCPRSPPAPPPAPPPPVLSNQLFLAALPWANCCHCVCVCPLWDYSSLDSALVVVSLAHVLGFSIHPNLPPRPNKPNCSPHMLTSIIEQERLSILTAAALRTQDGQENNCTLYNRISSCDTLTVTHYPTIRLLACPRKMSWVLWVFFSKWGVTGCPAAAAAAARCWINLHRQRRRC